MIDLNKAPLLEIIIEQDPNQNWRLWVNGPEGCLLRAYRIEALHMRLNGRHRLAIVDENNKVIGKVETA